MNTKLKESANMALRGGVNYPALSLYYTLNLLEAL